MLELLLFTYKDQFWEDFSLAAFAGKPEYELINVLYDCVSNKLGRPVSQEAAEKSINAAYWFGIFSHMTA